MLLKLDNIYFVTKDTGNLRPTSEAKKGWIQGNMRIGPVLEVTTSFRHSNMESKFEFGL